MSDRSSWNNQKRAVSVLGLGGESANRLDTWMVWKFGPGWGVIPRPKDAKGDEGGAYLARKRHMQVVRTKPQPLSTVRKSVVHGGKARRRAASRVRRYGIDGLQPGGVAAEAVKAMTAAAGTTEASPVYRWPQAAPASIPTMLHMDELTVVRRERILTYVDQGVEDLAGTHVPLSALVPGDATLSAAGTTAESSAASDPLSAVVHEVLQGQGVEQQHQVYRLEDLEEQATAGAAAAVADSQHQTSRKFAVVPDSTRPFTVTMRNGKDGKDYVVAHYEPQALRHGRFDQAALLSQIFHQRHKVDRMSRTSAPDSERMVMAGMRIDRLGRFSRYAGDEGEWAVGRTHSTLRVCVDQPPLKINHQTYNCICPCLHHRR